MSNRSDSALLLDISNAAHNIAKFIEGMSENEFRSDLKTQAAVQHQLLLIGEAVKRLSPNFRKLRLFNGMLSPECEID